MYFLVLGPGDRDTVESGPGQAPDKMVVTKKRICAMELFPPLRSRNVRTQLFDQLSGPRVSGQERGTALGMAQGLGKTSAFPEGQGEVQVSLWQVGVPLQRPPQARDRFLEASLLQELEPLLCREYAISGC